MEAAPAADFTAIAYFFIFVSIISKTLNPHLLLIIPLSHVPPVSQLFLNNGHVFISDFTMVSVC